MSDASDGRRTGTWLCPDCGWSSSDLTVCSECGSTRIAVPPTTGTPKTFPPPSLERHTSHLPGVFGGSLLGAIVGAFLFFDPGIGEFWAFPVAAGFAFLGGWFVHRRYPMTPKRSALAVGTGGWLFGTVLGIALRVLGGVAEGL